ncbi:putative oxidosqualene:lanosterol cyclase [Phaeomoniella chlamydospora]|uniref:Terpene cyclase/mutase family member n=1 Tax=Phaeomoniella chlamydospora TaxID=158046 RepID=A0A0G2EJU0_PHACM|nr:putative oxidosqualene:lanosterol cyclase [Phaeomoniella chlamydospora]
MHFSDIVAKELPDLPPAKRPSESINNVLDFYSKLQLPAGHWGCEYDGPMFLLPGIVITWYVTGTPIPEHTAIEIKRYLYDRQNKDGGWGLHIEGASTVFGTTMNYIVMRILGASAEEPRIIKARGLLHQFGGALYGPHWSKLWLCILNIMPWETCNPTPPEMWLLPNWVPVHPWRWWIHIRMVFLPMSYISSKKFQHPLNPLTKSLREELFVEPYETINFPAYRSAIAPSDNYHPKSWLLNLFMFLIANIWYPLLRPNFLKKRGEDWVYELVCREDENTDFACLAPVNAPLNTICCYIHDGPGSYTVRRHLERLHDFIWVKSNGMMVSGTNGVQVWDTAFSILSIVEAGLTESPKWRPMLEQAHAFLDRHQIREEVREREVCYRQQRKGAWPFSTKTQGYTVTDCTSEGLKAILLLQNIHDYPKLLSERRIFDAIDLLLTMQNPSGGFASYEPTRGPEWLEMLNAAEVFGRIMIEYDYPECTTAVVTAMSLFQKLYPKYRTAEIAASKARAVKYIKDAQAADGSWYGSWGICFTYAAMFALESLASIGEIYSNSERVRKGCHFLLSHQMADSGWGESYRGCELKTYVNHEKSQVVNTSWACIALMHAEYPDKEPMKKALTLIMSRQQRNGEWLQEAIEGVFNCTTMITYPNYKYYFPVKALGMYQKRFGDEELL